MPNTGGRTHTGGRPHTGVPHTGAALFIVHIHARCHDGKGVRELYELACATTSVSSRQEHSTHTGRSHLSPVLWPLYGCSHAPLLPQALLLVFSQDVLFLVFALVTDEADAPMQIRLLDRQAPPSLHILFLRFSCSPPSSHEELAQHAPPRYMRVLRPRKRRQPLGVHVNARAAVDE